jgi:hypothetical protein
VLPGFKPGENLLFRSLKIPHADISDEMFKLLFPHFFIWYLKWIASLTLGRKLLNIIIVIRLDLRHIGVPEMPEIYFTGD